MTEERLRRFLAEHVDTNLIACSERHHGVVFCAHFDSFEVDPYLSGVYGNGIARGSAKWHDTVENAMSAYMSLLAMNMP